MGYQGSSNNVIVGELSSTIDATDKAKGIIRIATEEEAFSGSSTNTAITPHTMKLVGDEEYGTSILLDLDQETFVLTVSLVNSNNEVLDTKTVDFPSESAFVDGRYESETKTLVLVLQSGAEIEIPLGDIINGLQEEITVDNKLSSDLIDDNNKNNKFITPSQKTFLDGLTVTQTELNELHEGTATKNDFIKLHNTTSTANEINQLHESGIEKSDLEKLHAITSTNTEINQLHESGVVKADLEKLHSITSTSSEINELHESGVIKSDLEKLHSVTTSDSELNILDGATLSTTELNYVDGVTGPIQEQLNDKLELDSISIENGSTNYLGYDTLTGEISAKVDTVVTENSDKLITSDGVYDAIKDDITLTDLSIDNNSTDYLGYDNTTGEISAKVDVNPTKNSTKLVGSGGVFANTINDVKLKTSTTDTVSVTKGDETTDIKISKVDEAIKATKDEDNNNIKSTYATKTEVQNDITLTDLSIDSGSGDYLNYDNTTGKFSANVDTVVGTVLTNLVTSGAVLTAIANALLSVFQYKGTWNSTSQVDYSSITLPIKKGYCYRVTGTGATIDGVEWNAGDVLVIENDVASGGTITTNDISKWDFTESTDIVRLAVIQTLTNKTIDADNNTILNLETDNLKSGVLKTTIRATNEASDTSIASEKAIAGALDNKQNTSTAVIHTANTAVGNSTTPVFVNSNGEVVALSCTLATSVPVGAVFTDTTYTFSTGSTNGTIAVSVNGGTAVDVLVKGLGSAAFTSSSSYATSTQGGKADSALQPNDNISLMTNNAGYISDISSFNIGDLSNVVISNPTAGQNLTYDAVLGKWKNTTTSATIAWGGITGTLADQTDLYNILAELSVNQSLEDYLDLIIDGNTANLPIVITNPYNSAIASIITGA